MENPPTLEEFLSRTLNFELHEWQRKVLCPLLERFAKERGLRVLLHAPPQFGKSIIVSRRFPAWLLGKKPKAKIVIAGYNEDHTTIQFGMQLRNVMLTSEYVDMFPNPACRIRKEAAASEFSTAARLRLNEGQHSVTCLGLISGFTGKGLGIDEEDEEAAALLLIDDPYKSPEEARSPGINAKVCGFWDEQARLRIDDNTNVLVVFHRYHLEDLGGKLLAEGGWEHVRLPATGDENEDGSDPTGREIGEPLSPIRSPEFLRHIEEQDPMIYLGMYQGRPRKATGEVIHELWLRDNMVDISAVPRVKQWVRYWDLSSMKTKTRNKKGNDYTSGALIGIGPNGLMYLLDVVRFRKEWPEAREIIEATSVQDLAWCKSLAVDGYEAPDYAVGFEEVFWQAPMLQDFLAREVFNPQTGIHVWPCPVQGEGDKKLRASGWIARAKFNQFCMVLGWEHSGPWHDPFIEEAKSFDGLETTHDDQMDAVSGAYKLTYILRGELLEKDIPAEAGSPEYYRAFLNEYMPGNDDGFGDTSDPDY